MINWIRVRLIKGQWEGRKVYRLFVGEKFVDMIIFYSDDPGWHSDSYPLIDPAPTAEEIAKQVLMLERYL